MVLNYTSMYQGYKTSYKTEILSRDKKSISLMPLFLEPAPPRPSPVPPFLLKAPCSRVCRLCVDFLQVSCSGDSFYLKGQFFQRGTKQN